MKKRAPLLSLVLLLFSINMFSEHNYTMEPSELRLNSTSVSISQINPRVILPLHIRLEALQKSNVTLWQSVPKNFSDHVATIESRVLALFISSNSYGFDLSTDNIGNTWLTANYSLNVGDYIDTLAWVSSKATAGNLSSLGFVQKPETYPSDVQAYLDPGTKIQAQNQTIQSIADSYTQANLTQTVKDILDFVNTQGYDEEETRLLLGGNLNTTDIIGFFKDALQVHDSSKSICLERSWYASAILRAAGVPTRTVTDIRLKTWIQVWLPNIGWVDAETLCRDAPPHLGMLPKPISMSTPWMVQNSSDAAFPFTWVPKVPMRVANLTFSRVDLFDVNEYSAVITEPIEAEMFQSDMTKFRFPIAINNETETYAAMTKEGDSVTFSLFGRNENASKVLTLGQSNSITLENTAISFKPVRRENFVILQDFSVQGFLRFDIRFVIPIMAVPIVALAVWLILKRRKPRR